jgi:hypothetical protein
MGDTPGLSPTDDPGRGECVQVIAVERNGPRRAAVAEIIRHGETATLGPWNVAFDQKGWLVELLEEGHSDREPKEEPPVPKLSAQESAMYGPALETFEIYDQLADLLADQINDDPPATLVALELKLRSIAQNSTSPKDFAGVARFLKDHPDDFPMFSTAQYSAPSNEHVHRCKATLQRFIDEKRKAGCTDAALIASFINMYMHLGSQIFGALRLAKVMEGWEPEPRQSMMRQASSQPK